MRTTGTTDSVLTLLAAFGSGTVAAVTAWPAAWVALAVVVGVFSRGRLVSALAGFLGAAFAWATLQSSLAPLPAFEGPDYGVILGPPMLALATFAALWVGARLQDGPRPEPNDPPKHRGPRAILGTLGAGAIVAVVVTTAIQVQVPSRRSFEIDLPGGWTVLRRAPMEGYVDPTYGAHFTAVLGPSDPSFSVEPPIDAVIGVTVIRADYSQRACIRDVHGFAPGGGPVYAWPVLEEGDVNLPVGPAYRLIRAEPDGAARLYGWGVTRRRQVGMLGEGLCYMLVISTPSEAELSRAEAEAIASTFRFR